MKKAFIEASLSSRAPALSDVLLGKTSAKFTHGKALKNEY